MRITKIDESAYFPEYAVRRFEELGEFVKYDDRPTESEAIQRLNDTDIAIVEWTEITREMLQQIEGLKHIVVALTGYEFVDVKAARERGILVSNIAEYSRQSVAEHVFAMLLFLNRKIRQADQAARAGKRDYYEDFLTMELYGKTLGVLGLGSIGSWVARIGQGFGMHTIAHSRAPKNRPGIEDVSLDELLRRSDVVVVCVDHNDTTAGLLSKQRLSLLKPTAFFLSIAPPGICDESALAGMLQTGRLAGVGLDIPEEDSPLEAEESAVLTPGIAWHTQDSLDRLASIMIENVESFLAGNPRNVVN